MAFTNLSHSFARLGPVGVFALIIRKIEKQRRYKRMLAAVPNNNNVAILKQQTKPSHWHFSERDSERELIVNRAEAMLRDENLFFTFPYRTSGLERAWEFDPIENKYWPRRHYTEHELHDHDTPRDVKIVFEINRFKDLPALGQAALITSEKKYASEVERRLLSWIEENPFAFSVNWSSALEISIRLISWTTTLLLLRGAGFPTADHPKIKRSIYEQACYLAADMGTDKVVSSNHLIGEATGLFVVASLWEFNASKEYATFAKRLLEREIIQQTFEDGVTREASSWYHQFITHFFDLADRIATGQSEPFSNQYQARLSNLKGFREKMIVTNEVIRYGDADDGWALFLEGNDDRWKNFIFGHSSSSPSESIKNYFPTTKIVASRVNDAFLFMRAGAFGMGGAGFSSHAHDDFLSPIIYLDGRPVLVDPGTFVYSADPEKRMIYRKATAHNGLVFGNSTGAIPRKQFGWEQIRVDAIIHETTFHHSEAKVTASYGESPQHQRTVTIHSASAKFEDRFLQPVTERCEWRLHLAPEWILDNNDFQPQSQREFHLQNTSGDRLKITLLGNFQTMNVEPYDFSPSYLVAVPGTMLRLTSSSPMGIYTIQLTIDKHA